MGPEYWKPDKNSKLLKCSERSLPKCSGDTEDCCKVVACEYCLTFASEGYATEYGVASGSTEWSGSVGGASFFAFWEKLYNGVCYFIVTINGFPVSVADCGSTSCRDSSGTANVVIGGHSGTLQWTKRLHKPLQYVIDPLTNCRVHFCGDCECTCESLCAVVTEPPPYPGETVDTTVLDPYKCDGLLPADCGFCPTQPPDSMTWGELPNVEDDACLPPRWSGTIAGRSINLSLTRGIYGQCQLSGSIYGEAVEPINVTDCKSITASFILEDGTKIDVACKECGCDTGPPDDALDCCDKVPCAFCVTYTPYGGDPETVHSEYNNGEWSGNVGGSDFLMYWYINPYGECAFVVEYNGVIVLEQTVAEGASCDDTSGSVVIGDDVLSWSIVPQTALKRQDEETPFCGACDCVSECFCISITDPPQRLGTSETFINGETHKGELCNSAYECEPPRWVGAVGDHVVNITLEADKVTGGCVLLIEIDGEIFTEGITLCDDVTISLETYDGTLVEIASKKCECAVDTVGNCICGRPMGDTLRVLWSSANGTHGTAEREFLVYYGMQEEYAINCAPWSPGAFPGYRGSVKGTFPMPMGGTQSNELEVIIVCECIGCEYCIYYRWIQGSPPGVWYQRNYTILSCECPAILDVVDGFDQGDGGGYQIQDITFYELESNC